MKQRWELNRNNPGAVNQQHWYAGMQDGKPKVKKLSIFFKWQNIYPVYTVPSRRMNILVMSYEPR